MQCLAKMAKTQKRLLFNPIAMLRFSASGLIMTFISILCGTGYSYAETDKKCLAIWKKPSVNIDVVSAAPTIDHGKSSQEIERIAKKSGYAKSSRHASLLGLTHSTIGPSLGASTEFQEVKSGQYCLRLDTVKLTFGARKTDIYIDRKYRKDSCAYQAILSHEEEHVRINEKMIAEYLPKITKELAERAATIKPFFTKHPKDAGKSIVNRLLFELDPVLTEFGEARIKANDVIDTQASYAATQGKCDDW